MQPAYQNNWATVHVGDAKRVLSQLPEAYCHAIITSPPYWGLRAYIAAGHLDKPLEIGTEPVHCCAEFLTTTKCGQCYICHLVAVFDEVRRMLRKDGVCFVVIGDSYSSGDGGSIKSQRKTKNKKRYQLRADLTGEQRAYVLGELAKANRISLATQSGRL